MPLGVNSLFLPQIAEIGDFPSGKSLLAGKLGIFPLGKVFPPSAGRFFPPEKSSRWAIGHFSRRKNPLSERRDVFPDVETANHDAAAPPSGSGVGSGSGSGSGSSLPFFFAGWAATSL